MSMVSGNDELFTCSQCWNVPYFVGTPQPAKRYEADFDSGNFHRLYEEFISILALNTSPLVQITMEQFSKLYFFVCLDLTGCPSCNSSHKHVASEARVNISAEVTFKTAPTESLQLITYSIQNKVISVDKHRDLSIDHWGEALTRH